jgi:hypothetical protein
VSTVDLRLQLPGASKDHLLDALLDAASGAERGGGIFAFATADGIRTLLGEDAFHGLLEGGPFELVVGVDATTNARALNELAHKSKQHSGLSGLVFLHDLAVIFHPKLSWFASGKKLTLIVGSGNLTVRGLRGNWEAFTVATLSGAAASSAESKIRQWLEVHSVELVSPTDPRAIQRAERNTGRERDQKHPPLSKEPEPLPKEALVLVAEAPKSGSRPSQVNFSKHFYENFFGAKAGTKQQVLLYSVSSSGTIGDAEVRPSSNRDSRNFSLELNAFRTPPPTTGPPVIGVYVKLPEGVFLYQRVAPGESGYEALGGLLSSHWSGRSREMRRVAVSLSTAQSAWPSGAVWTAEVP